LKVSNNKDDDTSYIDSSFSPTTAIADSGCTDLLFKADSSGLLDDVQPHNGLILGTAVPEQFLQSSHKGELRIPTKNGDIILPGFVFEKGKLENNLAGLSPLCNSAGCTITLTSTAIIVSKDEEILWQGSKSVTDPLWHLDFADLKCRDCIPEASGEACQSIRLDTNAEYVKFVHAVFGSCPISTFLNAMDKGWFGNLPRLTALMIRQNPPVVRATAMGYLDQSRQGQRSTRKASSSRLHSGSASGKAALGADIARGGSNRSASGKGALGTDVARGGSNRSASGKGALGTDVARGGRLDVSRDIGMDKGGKDIKANNSTLSNTDVPWPASIYMEDISNSSNRGRSNSTDDGSSQSNEEEVDSPFLKWNVFGAQELMNSSDATGRFPITTKSGWNYLLVSTMGGYVHLELLKDRTKGEYIRAYKQMYAYFKMYGHTPTIQRLDNESSTELELFLRELEVDTQFVPPGIHRQNPSERAIRHTKNCIIAMCMTADEGFPGEVLFEEVVEQAEIVINQLHPCLANPKINAWTGFRGRAYDHLAHPMSVFGMRVVVHEKSQARRSWATHGKDGFYTAPALLHYRCWSVYVLETGSTRVSDTLAWFPKPYTMPGHSPLEQLTAAVKDMNRAITNATTEEHSHMFNTTLSEGVKEMQNLFSPTSVSSQHTDSSEPSPSVIADAPIQRVPEQPSAAIHNISQDGCSERRSSSTSSKSSSTYEVPTTNTSTTYHWQVLRVQDAPTRARKYFQYCKRLFKDDYGTHQIVSIDRNNACHKGKGSQTVFYKYYNVLAHMTPPTNIDDYDHIPCAELHKDVGIEWTTPAATSSAFLAATATSLNLNDDGTPITLASVLAGKFRNEWEVAADEEFRKLITTTKTMRPIHKQEIPADRRKDITYYNPVLKEKMKEGVLVRRVRGTLGGDRINYTGEVTARTASLEVVRTLLNSVLADDADFMTADITDYYLNTPLLRSEYVRVGKGQISSTIVSEYNLDAYLLDGYYYFEVEKGMYGLPQSGLLAQQRLIKHLEKSEYTQSTVVPCLFSHPTNGITFVLVVDDFGVKFTNVEGRDHFLNTLRSLYKITTDDKGSQYLGMTIKHDKVKHEITISMPGYIIKLLERFKEWAGSRCASTPGIYRAPVYGSKVQLASVDDSLPLSASDTKILQEIVGGFLYYARAVDPVLLTAVGDISSSQANPTELVKDMAVRLLQYARAFPNNEIVYRKSKMHFIVQVDASYLSRSKGRSVAGGIGYFGDAEDPTTENGMVYAMSSIIDVVVASAGEAEYGSAFKNAQQSVSLRHIAIAMGHKQPATPILCDNEFAIGLASDSIKQKRSKSIDMRFHWLRDRIRQGQFRMIHLAGKKILADYLTKALPVDLHRAMVPRLVRVPQAAWSQTAWRRVKYRRGRLSPDVQ
jgi:hypothetical protein